MKCPLANYQLVNETLEREECLEEECAWWNTINGMCAVLQLSMSIFYTSLYISKMEAKMPPLKE